MKKLLLLVFALSLLPKGYAQDLLVTAKGDTVRCKILAKTDQQIFISVLQPDGTKISSYVSKDTIRTITPGYFVTESSPEKVTPLLTAPPMNQREKTKHSPHGVRFALSGGYSHRLGKLASGLKSSYKTGFVIGRRPRRLLQRIHRIGWIRQLQAIQRRKCQQCRRPGPKYSPGFTTERRTAPLFSVWVWVTYPTRRACHP